MTWFDASGTIALVVLLGLWIGTFASARAAGPAFRDVPKAAWIALAAIVLADILLVQQLAPHTVWHSFNHGIRRVAEIRDGLDAPDLAQLHGHGYFVLMNALYHRIAFGAVSLFSLTWFVSVASGVLAFLLAWLHTSRASVALVAAVLMAVLPLRLRVGASEDMFVVLEFYLLATLVLLSLYSRTGKARFWHLALAALFLWMQTRAEALVLAPLTVAAWVVLRDPGAVAGLVRREGRGRLAGLAVLIAASVPWVIAAFETRDHRIASTPLSLLSRPMPLGALDGPFFDPSATPIPFLVAFIAGMVALAVRDRRLALAVVVFWAPAAWFYAHFDDSFSTWVRCGMATRSILVIVSAAGVVGAADLLVRLVRRRPVSPAGSRIAGVGVPVVFCLVVAASSFGAADFVTQRFTSQEEFEFLVRVREALPVPSTVAILSNDDDPPGNLLDRVYQSSFLQRTTGGARVSFLSLGDLLAVGAGRSSRGPVLVYLGAPCVKIPAFDGSTEPGTVPNDASWVHPLCARIRAEFVLEPMIEVEIHRPDLSGRVDAIQGEAREIGLYKVIGRR